MVDVGILGNQVGIHLVQMPLGDPLTALTQHAEEVRSIRKIEVYFQEAFTVALFLWPKQCLILPCLDLYFRLAT